MVADNEGHSLKHRENLVAFLARTQRFLEKKLDMKPCRASKTDTLVQAR